MFLNFYIVYNNYLGKIGEPLHHVWRPASFLALRHDQLVSLWTTSLHYTADGRGAGVANVLKISLQDTPVNLTVTAYQTGRCGYHNGPSSLLLFTFKSDCLLLSWLLHSTPDTMPGIEPLPCGHWGNWLLLHYLETWERRYLNLCLTSITASGLVLFTAKWKFMLLFSPNTLVFTTSL